MKVRAATDADVPAIAAIILAAAAAEVPWKSYLPAGACRDPILVQHVEAVARAHIVARDSAVVVGELSAAESGRDTPEVVSVAVWDTTTAAERDDSWAAVEEHHAQLAALDTAMRRGRQLYFAAEPPHLFLRVLATHPDRRGRGYAKALCRWGMALARRRRVGVCVETGAARGYVLFSGLGFRDLGVVDLPPVRGRHEGTEEEGQVLKALRMDAEAVRAANPGAWDSFCKYIFG
ncbi:Acyl-CoA N-acyltransferase [Cordyceps fumosorosea ARSEF 2679]|uniref:Acyl-CoA N-acyltransferase n=1 Tax=Cordyceps fumosorosea (strain ARSEF 2679) TaxID=1081104 RepID=A0A168BUQ4_CORFA|nr:Acyl-CoA N-acyltransferase [Cordyceps fumosorosea ARSEF 2679]OAA70575.1 Acyl-CoA N-acyltransferase [Cordyceps fumosorosea ARSEF 2679]